MTEPSERVAGVLAALADPTRRQLLDVLAELGSATATRLAADLPVSRQAVVKHLAVLDRAGIVVGVRSGREVRYTLQPRALDVTTQWLSWISASWDARLEAIRQIAELAEEPSPHLKNNTK